MCIQARGCLIKNSKRGIGEWREKTSLIVDSFPGVHCLFIGRGETCNYGRLNGHGVSVSENYPLFSTGEFIFMAALLNRNYLSTRR